MRLPAIARQFCGIATMSLLVLNSGCLSELNPVDMPLVLTAPPGAPIDTACREQLEGVYTVLSGNNTFGDTLVAKWVKSHFCLYAGAQVILMETAASIGDDTTARFSGYYRFVRSEQSGNLTLNILPADGGRHLRSGNQSTSFTIRGRYREQNSDDSHDIVLTRSRSFFPKPKFQILGNCAGGRNSERLGRSENSIEMGRFSEYLGCTGVEIDLHVTQDGKVILMHDDSYSPRTLESTYILGDVSKFTLRQIRRNARLIHGEEIPTLQEFLTDVVDSTNLEYVWLDPKVTDQIEQMLEAQKAATEYARSKGRTLEIVFGLPSKSILAAYRACPSSNDTSIHVLCELTPDDVRSIPACTTWGPRWTLGLMTGSVAQLQSEGYQVIPWTIDSPDYMKQFLDGCPFDGILSNYPSMLTGQFYQR